MSSKISGSESLSDVPEGSIHLVLLLDPLLYLQIPLNEIIELCLRPRKYLAFVGWCILAIEGGLVKAPDSAELDPDGELDDRALLYFVKDGGVCTGMQYLLS